MSRIKLYLEDEFYKHTQSIALHWMEQDFYESQKAKNQVSLRGDIEHDDALRQTSDRVDDRPIPGQHNQGGSSQ